MTIVGLKVDRFKRIRAVNLQPGKTGLVELHGRNGQGKSSVLDAIEIALMGGRSPQAPVFNNEGRADIHVDLGEITVWLRWTDPNDLSKRALTVENKVGGKLETPQAVLDALTSRMIDPTRFLMESEPEQARQVLDMVELDIDLAQSRREEAVFEQDRLLEGREVKKLEGQVSELENAAAEAPSQRVDMASLTADLQAAIDHNKIHAETEARRTAALKTYREAKEAVEDKVAEIERLRAELAAAEESLPELEQAVVDRLEEGKAIKSELEALGPERDTAPIQSAIESAQASAAAFSAADRLHDRQTELAAARETFAATEKKIETLRTARLAALESADWPVQGLGFDPEHGSNGRLTFKGNPFSQASQAERLRIVGELAMKKDAPIRVMICREGSFLDSENLAMLGEIAEQRGWQVWVEIVDDAPTGVGLYIEDGQASGQGAV